MFICCSTVFFPTLQRSSRYVSYVLFCPFQNLQSFYIFFQSVAWEIIIMCQKMSHIENYYYYDTFDTFRWFFNVYKVSKLKSACS